MGDWIRGEKERRSDRATGGPMEPRRSETLRGPLIVSGGCKNTDGQQNRGRNTPADDAPKQQPQPAEKKHARSDAGLKVSGGSAGHKFLDGGCGAVAKIAEQSGAAETVGVYAWISCHERRKRQQNYCIADHGGIKHVLTQTAVSVFCEADCG